MKILIHGLNFSPELTGIGKYTGELAQALARRGHQVRVVTTPPYYPQWQIQPGFSKRRYIREVQKNLTIIRCPLWVPKRVSGLTRVLHLLSFGVVWREARSQPDVILSIAPALAAAPAALLAARRCKAFTWLHIQDFEVDAALDLGIVNNRSLARAAAVGFEKWVYRKFDCLSTISRKMVERLAEKGIPPGKTVFFPNWVDTELIHPLANPSALREELGISSQQVVVLYSGNMGKKQGLEILARAARELQPLEKDILFVFCGAGSMLPDLQADCNGLGNVRFLPLQPLERLNDLLNMADIHALPQSAHIADLVLPSKLSGMLASGRPVIATAAKGTGLYEIVSRVGLAVPPEDVSALVGAIQQLAHDPALRQSMGKMSRAYAEEHFSKAKILNQFEADLLVRAGR